MNLHSSFDNGFWIRGLPFKLHNMARTYLHILPICLFVLQAQGSPNQITIPNILTTSGEVAGVVNITTSPNVAQYLGVPYAEDPVGKLRFSPPVAKSPLAGVIKASQFGPSCPQYNTSTPTFFSVAAPEYYIEGPMGEDCLSLNVWTPLWAVTTGTRRNEITTNGSDSYDRYASKQNLPVIIFLHGGQFTVGGSRVAYHKGDKWVERSQSHVLVTIK
jgi:acetylcholinesterase